MALQRQDTLLGYAFQVREEPQVVTGDDGRPIFDQGSATPKLEVLTKLMLQSQDGTHVVIVPLSGGAKDELLRQLTGGIVVANGNLNG